MRDKAGPAGIPCVSFRVIASIIATAVPFLAVIPSSGRAQVPPITPSGLNTQVSGPISVGTQTQYNITGGTRPGGGTNLFQSFGQFNVPTNNIANFLNTPVNGVLPATSNILARVTGTNGNNPTLSSIFGTIQTTGFGNANLFLMNPAGFLFGPNATVNVGGMVAFTTADYLRFQGNQTLFNNASTPESLSPLSIAPVAAFGFLGANPGAITVQGSQFSVADGTGISLVGGNITIQSGTPDGGTAQPARLSAPNGKIQLASAASPGEFDAATLQPLPNVANASFTSFGSVTLAPGSNINVSGTNTVSIRGGQFVLSVNDAVLSTSQTAGQPETISLSQGSSIISSNAGTDPGADVQIIAGNLQMDGASIQTTTTGDGPGGNISIGVQTVSLTNGAQIVSSTSGIGAGGNITISATGSVLISGFDTSGTLTGATTGLLFDPISGNPLVTSGVFTTTSVLGTCPGCSKGGSIRISASTLTLDNAGTIATISSGDGRGGDITLNADTITVKGGAQLWSSTGQDPATFEASGSGDGGDINVTATESFLVSGGNPDLFASSIVQSQASNSGNGGNVQISAPNVSINGGATVASVNFGTGTGGNVTVSAPNQLLISGIDEVFGSPSQITTLSFSDGNGGALAINAGSVTVTNSGTIHTDASGAGNAGNLTMSVQNNLDITGLGSIVSSSSSSSSGDITITADTITLSGQAAPSQFSRIANFGGSTTGDINISARELFMTDGGRINSVAEFGQTGAIRISSDSVTISDGAKIRIDGGLVGGGLIDITANTIILNQGILQTQTSSRGDAGAINITADNLILSGGFINSTTNSGSGARGGDVTITVRDKLLISGQFNGSPSDKARPAGISTSTTSLGGDAGSVTILTGSFEASNGAVVDSSTSSAGKGGAITVTAGSMTSIAGSGTGLFSQANGPGDGGAITVQSPQVQITDGAVISAKSIGSRAAGSVTIEGTASPAQSVLIDGVSSGIFTNTQGTGPGGNIFLNANSVTLQNGGTLSAATSGTAPSATGGAITVKGSTVQLNSAATITTATSGPGNAGDILVKADTFSMNGGAMITAASTGSGNAGNVTIQGLASPAQSASIDGAGSGLFTTTSGSGAGGNIVVNANTVTLQNGGTFSAKTSGTDVSATGGTISVNAGQVNLTNGGLITASSTGAGDGGSITIGAGSTFGSNASTVSSTAAQAQGGDITITAGQSVTLNNGSLITASSSGLGNAGNILINAGQNYTSTDSAVTTQAAQASGGNITLLATGTVQLTNSQLNASVQGSSTTVGGNITIDPQYVILLNSQILAQATQGQGGAISINITNGGLYLPDANSTVSASSQFGVDGIVTIQSPNAPAGGKIIPLSQKPLLATSLLNQRCASLAGGEFSSFTVAGRDSLPTEPGGWLASPLALSLGGTGGGTLAEKGGRAGIDDDPARETTIVSLRQIAPAGFLTQSFAVEGSAGCQS